MHAYNTNYKCMRCIRCTPMVWSPYSYASSPVAMLPRFLAAPSTDLGLELGHCRGSRHVRHMPIYAHAAARLAGKVVVQHQPERRPCNCDRNQSPKQCSPQHLRYIILCRRCRSTKVSYMHLKMESCPEDENTIHRLVREGAESGLPG